MESSEQIKKFGKFFEQYYQKDILEKITKGEMWLAIDFSKLSEFNPELADDLLEEPEEVVKAAEIATEDFDIEGKMKDFKIRIFNLPETQKIMIRNIRSKNIGKLLSMEGVVRQKSDVRPQVTSSKFECPSCGNIMNVLQLDERFKEPNKCGCGRKGKFKLLSKELIDAQGLTLEEAPEDLEGGEQPKRMKVLLKGDLVSPMSEKKTNPGTRIEVIGQVKDIPIILRSGGKSIRFDLVIEANYVEASTEDFYNLEITKEDEKEIKKLSKDLKVYEKLTQNIATSIYGLDRIKEALLLQLFGGVRKKRVDGVTTRGDMHVLLIGDPGAGKSMLLKRINVVAPKGRFISGKGVSGAGLTATVVKDEFLGGWSLEAGALVLANKGMCMIDELDKMGMEDRAAMHEALEGQTVTISKANIQATLRAETTVLAAANPKFGRFDPYGTVAEQIDLPPTLINRFDLIFAVKDIPDEKTDEKLSRFILDLHQNVSVDRATIETSFIRKYIAYAKRNCKPKLTDTAMDEIQKYYLKMRGSGMAEKGRKAVPISARQLEGLIRMSEAVARVRLGEKVSKKDAKKAVSLLDYCLRQIAFDEETGTIDIDRIATSIPATQRSKIITVKEVIIELEDKLGKTIPIEEVTKECGEKGVEEEQVEDAIEKLKRSGDIFEPKKGFISRI